MRRVLSQISSAAALVCLSLVAAPPAEAQAPTPPQIVHRVGSAVDDAASHVRRDLGPHRRHHRVRHVRYVRHVRHGRVYYTRVVYYR